MDGNRRWARDRTMPHYYTQASFEAITRVVGFCLKHSIAYLSLYALSLENIENRNQEEIALLWQKIEEGIAYLEKKHTSSEAYPVRVRFCGDRERIPAQLLEKMCSLEEKTAENTALTLSILIAYGGQQEIVHAVNTLLATFHRRSLTVKEFSSMLWSGGVPFPDLILRTGGACRLSNFLLFQSAYSEFMTLSCYWPDITSADLTRCIEAYSKTFRTFGS